MRAIKIQLESVYNNNLHIKLKYISIYFHYYIKLIIHKQASIIKALTYIHTCTEIYFGIQKII